MKNYAVIQHNYSEFLGLIERQLEIRDIGFNYIRPFVGQDLPGNVLMYDALFILGGSWPPSDQQNQRWIDAEIALIKRFVEADRPVVGLGLGAQVLAMAFGGTASSTPSFLARWVKARCVDANDPVAQIMDGRDLLLLANGQVELPDSIPPLLEDEQGQWLAIRPHPLAYGLLFRPELKPGMLEDMVMEAGRETPDNIGELLTQARQRWGQTQQDCDELLVVLVQQLQLMQERKKPSVFSLKVEKP